MHAADVFLGVTLGTVAFVCITLVIGLLSDPKDFE